MLLAPQIELKHDKIGQHTIFVWKVLQQVSLKVESLLSQLQHFILYVDSLPHIQVPLHQHVEHLRTLLTWILPTHKCRLALQYVYTRLKHAKTYYTCTSSGYLAWAAGFLANSFWIMSNSVLTNPLRATGIDCHCPAWIKNMLKQLPTLSIHQNMSQTGHDT